MSAERASAAEPLSPAPAPAAPTAPAPDAPTLPPRLEWPVMERWRGGFLCEAGGRGSCSAEKARRGGLAAGTARLWAAQNAKHSGCTQDGLMPSSPPFCSQETLRRTSASRSPFPLRLREVFLCSFEANAAKRLHSHGRRCRQDLCGRPPQELLTGSLASLGHAAWRSDQRRGEGRPHGRL